MLVFQVYLLHIIHLHFLQNFIIRILMCVLHNWLDPSDNERWIFFIKLFMYFLNSVTFSLKLINIITINKMNWATIRSSGTTLRISCHNKLCHNFKDNSQWIWQIVTSLDFSLARKLTSNTYKVQLIKIFVHIHWLVFHYFYNSTQFYNVE
jgi:hypothetical protein